MKAPRDRARIAASRVLKKNRPAAMPRAHPGRSLRNSRFATCSRSRPMIAAEEAMPISDQPAPDLHRDDERESGRPTRRRAEAAAQREGEEQHRRAVGELEGRRSCMR